jgi:hypothetical protein
MRVKPAIVFASLATLASCASPTQSHNGLLDLSLVPDAIEGDASGLDASFDGGKIDGGSDGAMPDLSRPFDAGGADLVRLPDLTTSPDQAMADLAMPDLAVAVDLAMDDLAVARDLSMADLVSLPDLAPLPDLVSLPDLVPLPDLTPLPDLAPIPDMAMPAIYFSIIRVGDGQAALSSSSTALFVEKRKIDGTLIGQAIPLPIADANNQHALTISGSSTAEGGLTLATNGHYLALAGYDAAPGVATIGSSSVATYHRIVGRIDAAGNVDTSTVIDTGFNGGSVRCAATDDGTRFWVSGSSSGATGGVHYIPFGMTGSTQVESTPSTMRWLNIFGAQLYGSAASGAFFGPFTVGNGLPTMVNQTATLLPGFPAMMGPSPYGFVLFDRDNNVAGLDTAYVADDNTLAKGGGIQKWTFDGMTWKQAAFTTGLTTGVRGLTGLVLNNQVVLAATTTETNANNLVTIVDDGVSMAQTIATTANNTAFRGVALSPN